MDFIIYICHIVMAIFMPKTICDSNDRDLYKKLYDSESEYAKKLYNRHIDLINETVSKEYADELKTNVDSLNEYSHNLLKKYKRILLDYSILQEKYENANKKLERYYKTGKKVDKK